MGAKRLLRSCPEDVCEYVHASNIKRDIGEHESGVSPVVRIDVEAAGEKLIGGCIHIRH